jgi:hypothetical protein
MRYVVTVKQYNTSSLISRLINIKTKAADSDPVVDIDNEDSTPDERVLDGDDNILEVLQKDKNALALAEQAYPIALDKFLNAQIN